MKILKIVKALAKPRPIIGIITLALAITLASAQGVAFWWSIPAGLFFAEQAGFIYEWFEKERKATPTRESR